MGEGTVDSKWWYVVLGTAILEPLAYFTPVILGETGLYTQEMIQNGTINVFAYIGLLLVLTMFLSIPVLAISLHQDATAIRESALAWNPTPRLWAVAGLVVPIGAFIMGTPAIWLVATVYLVRRFQASDGGIVPDIR